MTGDYNTTETSAVFADLLTHLGVVDAKQSAVTLVRNYASYQGLGVKAKEQENPRSLDHILLNNHARAFTFNTVIGLGVENISDHLPILADLSFV
jgi:endonuclease/exonuclease/phosphatase family metal-dependent hydrolase